MKHIAILILVLVTSFGAPSPAADPATHTYTAEVAGMMCSACSDKVKFSLGTLEGVKSIKIKGTDKPGVARVEIRSTSSELTKEAAIKSLGASASSYNILSFKRTDS